MAGDKSEKKEKKRKEVSEAPAEAADMDVDMEAGDVEVKVRLHWLYYWSVVLRKNHGRRSPKKTRLRLSSLWKICPLSHNLWRRKSF